MRPRIEQSEAKFLVEVLEKDKATYEKLEADLNEIMKPLKITVNRACWCVNHYLILEAKREHDYPNCVNKLCQLQAEQIVALRKVVIYKCLIAKYRQISEGKGRGRYKVEAHEAGYKISHVADAVFLGYKTYRDPLQVEAPKI